jgi:hypothetical protein
MRYFVIPLIIGLIAVVPTLASARGGPLHLYGPFERHSLPVSRSGIPTPSISPNHLLGGCGRGRYRDLKTQICRGPADVTH